MSDNQANKVSSPSWQPIYGAVSPPSSDYISANTKHAFFLSAATLEIRRHIWRGRRRMGAGFVPAMANPVLKEKPLNEMPKVIVLQDRKWRFAGLIRITTDAKCERGETLELVEVSRGSASGKDLKQCFEERMFRRSIYKHSKPFRAIYDENERWVDVSYQLYPFETEQYEVAPIGKYKRFLRHPGHDYQDNQDYEFYNVLWVQRGDDGVAYRAGCGRVLADFWEANNPVQTRIVLG